MIVAEADKSALAKIAHYSLISADMLGHSVRYLKKAYGSCIGLVDHALKRMYSVARGRAKFLLRE